MPVLVVADVSCGDRDLDLLDLGEVLRSTGPARSRRAAAGLAPLGRFAAHLRRPDPPARLGGKVGGSLQAPQGRFGREGAVEDASEGVVWILGWMEAILPSAAGEVWHSQSLRGVLREFECEILPNFEGLYVFRA